MSADEAARVQTAFRPISFATHNGCCRFTLSFRDVENYSLNSETIRR
jgi:hypothetical protein